MTNSQAVLLPWAVAVSLLVARGMCRMWRERRKPAQPPAGGVRCNYCDAENITFDHVLREHGDRYPQRVMRGIVNPLPPQYVADFSLDADQVCKRPPAGWTCSREPGHDGPCAARRLCAYGGCAPRYPWHPTEDDYRGEMPHAGRIEWRSPGP